MLVGGLTMAKDDLTAKRVGHKGADVWDKDKGTHRRVVEPTVIMLGIHPKARLALQRAEESLAEAQEAADSSAKNALYLMESRLPDVDTSLLQEMEYAAKLPVTAALLESRGDKSPRKHNKSIRSMIARIAFRLPSPSKAIGESEDKLRELCLQMYHLFTANEVAMDAYDLQQKILNSPDHNKSAKLIVSETVLPGVDVAIMFEKASVEPTSSGVVVSLGTNGVFVESRGD